MKICNKMFYDLNFKPNSISPCCNTRALAIPAFEYHGGEVDLEKYARHIENTLYKIQAGERVCKNCPELRDMDGEPHIAGGKFRTISINMHRYFCNCKCVYCDLWRHRDRGLGYDILPALKSLKSQGALAKNCHISWGGGEPGILPSFEEAAFWNMENGYSQLIHTNAIKSSRSIANMLRAGAGIVNISLDSASPDVYKRVKGVDCYYKVIGNLEKYASIAPHLVQLKYIVFEENNKFGEIEKFLRLAKNLQIGTVEYSLNFVEN